MAENHSKPFIDGDRLVLTEEHFRELDAYAKSAAGKPIVVRTQEAMRGERCFAYFSPMAVDVYMDLRKGPFLSEKGAIYLANEISLAEFYGAQRPEIDWSEIPPELVFRFIVAHEVGHAVLGVDSVAFFSAARDRGIDVDDHLRYAHGVAEEVLADRFAWYSLFPDQPLPRREGSESTVELAERFLAEWDDLYSRNRKWLRPLDTDPHMWVPKEHVRNGIPFAEAGERAAYAARISEPRQPAARRKTIVLPAEGFLILDDRLDPAAEPRHRIVAYHIHGTDPKVYVHTAGRDIVWAASIDRITCNERFVRGLHDPYEAVWLRFSAGIEPTHDGQEEFWQEGALAAAVV